MDITTKKPREARFFFLDSVTVNTVVHTESEACQKQCSGASDPLHKTLYVIYICMYIHIHIYTYILYCIFDMNKRLP